MKSKPIKDVRKALLSAKKDGFTDVIGIVEYIENKSVLNYRIRQGLVTVREYNGVHIILKNG